MLLKWVNHSRDSWNAHPNGELVVISKAFGDGRVLGMQVFRDGGVQFLTASCLAKSELGEMNAVIGEARAYLNQPVLERGD
jgi:hypothetical protein